MKRLAKFAVWSYLPVMVALLVVFTVAASAQTIDEIQQQLNDHITKRADIAARGDVQDKKAEDIKFVYDAWVKQSASYKEQLDTFNTKNADVVHQYNVLKPSLDNFTERMKAHNTTQCVEKCTQGGGCDGTCGWYERERIQLEQNQAQLKEAYAPLDAQAEQLESTKKFLDEFAGKLDIIGDGLSKDIPAWKQAEADIKTDWEANEAEIARLQALLAKLKGENDTCFAKIPPACQMNPLLDDKCEQMHAACGKMFDGNK